MASNIDESDLVDASEDDDTCMTTETENLIRNTSQRIDVREYEGNETNSDKLKSTLKAKGVKGVVELMNERLDSWKTEEVNIAVIGRTGVGKSSFINAIRDDLDESHKDYAKVSSNEGTLNRKAYRHPRNKRLIIWDLPGVGTDNYPRKTYIKHKKLKIGSYDAFILITCDRFTEDDEWLASEIEKMGKMFLFVRSKVDQDIENDRRLKEKARKVSDPLKVVGEIRQDCSTKLSKHSGTGSGDIYLISSLDINQEGLDFEKLLNRLVTGFTGLKAEVMLKSLGFLTSTLLEEKIKSLKKRIWAMGVLFSLTGLVPIPGTSLVADAALIVNETRLYRKSLGLSNADLEALAQLMGLPLDKLVEKYSLGVLALPLTVKGVVASSTLIASEAVESAVKLTIPVIGMTLGAVVSFATTVKFLRTVLTVLENDARQVLELLQKHAGQRVCVLSMSDTMQRTN